MLIRAIRPSDHATILRLNFAFENMLSPLDHGSLVQLLAQSSYQRVAVVDDSVSGFVLALREGCAYSSPNYRWFAERYAQFLYIDRIVVDTTAQSRGIGTALYRYLLEYARRSAVSTLTCEVDIDPPNPASQNFHTAFGFVEIGRQRLDDRHKTVSMQALAV